MSKAKHRTQIAKITLVVLLFIGFGISSVSAQGDPDPALVSQGESLFKENCYSCHRVHTKEVGPALKDVTKRRKKDWLYSWIRNSQKMIADGDKDAVALSKEYNGLAMNNFSTLKDNELDALLAYIAAESKIAPVEVKKETQDDGGETPKPVDNSQSTTVLILVIITLILVLITLLVFLNVVRKYLKDKEASLDEKDKELVNQKFDINAVIKSPIFITIVSLIFIGVAVRSCWVGMLSVGVEQNYAPAQPIPFSHKLHAGDNKINCNYCHTGVTKGKQANIPSLNICMNCHSEQGILKGPSGEDALKSLRDHYAKGTPVKWIRVHNLPDLAYFNHSQHVKVGGLECEECHGPIKEMDVVRQHSNLTMGWCINCHREKVVQSEGNAYYDRLIKVHEESKANKKDKVQLKVQDIGGLDCSKCHY